MGTWGCSSDDTSPKADGQVDTQLLVDGAMEDALPRTDQSVPDQSVPDQNIPDAPDNCVVMRTADKTECNEDCGVRLFLPGGDFYCSQICASTAECTPYGADLKCGTEIGACTPSCIHDAVCTTQGFKRCNLTEGVCDTIDAI